MEASRRTHLSHNTRPDISILVGLVSLSMQRFKVLIGNVKELPTYLRVFEKMLKKHRCLNLNAFYDINNVMYFRILEKYGSTFYVEPE